MDFSKHRRAIERMYEDRATIKRSIQVTASNKATRAELQIIYSDQPCRLSQQSLGKNDQTDVQNDIKYDSKLFIAPELEIRQGDVIEVTRRDGRKVTGTAGEPFPPYSTHQEVSLQRKGYA